MTIFDHTKHICIYKNPNYYDDLSDSDKKTWNQFIINKYFSFLPELLPIINYIQQFTFSDREHYIILKDLIPKGDYYIKFLKPKKKIINTNDIELFKKYFFIGNKDAKRYINLLENLGIYQYEFDRIKKELAEV